MLTVGIITRGKYGQRLITTLQKHTPFHIKTANLPEVLPEFIEDAEPLVAMLEEQSRAQSLFDCHILFTYSLHPDLTAAILERAGRSGVNTIIVPGGVKRCDLVHAKKVADKYHIHVLVEDICCALEPGDNPVLKEFTAYLGKPELSITAEQGVVREARVLRGAPCGSTWHAAEQISGLSTTDAPAQMGLVVQQYPCRAVRGSKSGIHTSAMLHREAVERALKE